MGKEQIDIFTYKTNKYEYIFQKKINFIYNKLIFIINQSFGSWSLHKWIKTF